VGRKLNHVICSSRALDKTLVGTPRLPVGFEVGQLLYNLLSSSHSFGVDILYIIFIRNSDKNAPELKAVQGRNVAITV
jgi:hypothetical protein